MSISIDPEYDRPPVLARVREAVCGQRRSKLPALGVCDRNTEEIRRAADFFGLSYNQNQGQIVHTLRTVLIGADGKIVKVYSGNQWKPSEVVRDYVAAEDSEGNTTGARATRADARSADNK